MAFTPPIPQTPLAVEVRAGRWRKLGPKDFSRGLEPEPLARSDPGPTREWSAIDDRGEIELTIERTSAHWTWKFVRLTDGFLVCQVWQRG